MNNALNIELIGEDTDDVAKPTKYNTAIKTKHGKWKLLVNTVWDDWVMGIIFPDEDKAEFFIKNFKEDMHDYRDGMLKDDYFVHIVHFKFPKPERLYADQITMTKNYTYGTI